MQTHTGILWSIVSTLSLTLSKNKMHQCHAYYNRLRSRHLVLSFNALYSPLKGEPLRDETK